MPASIATRGHRKGSVVSVTSQLDRPADSRCWEQVAEQHSVLHDGRFPSEREGTHRQKLIESVGDTRLIRADRVLMSPTYTWAAVMVGREEGGCEVIGLDLSSGTKDLDVSACSSLTDSSHPLLSLEKSCSNLASLKVSCALVRSAALSTFLQVCRFRKRTQNPAAPACR